MSFAKSSLISIALHAAIVSAFCCWTLPDRQSVAVSGISNVISVEGSFSSVATSETDAITMGPPVQLDRPFDRPLETQDARAMQAPSKPPNLAMPESPIEISTESASRTRPRGIPTETLPSPPNQPRREVRPRVRLAVNSVAGSPTDAKSKSADLSGNPAPTYPAVAVKNRWQGVVQLRFTITKEGLVRNIQVSQSSGFEVLDRAAIDAVKGWVVKPATRFGRAVSSSEVLPIRFRL